MKIVKIIREKLSLTQMQLSKEIGVSLRAVRSWEQGEREIGRKSAKRLAEYSCYMNNPISLDDIYAPARSEKRYGKSVVKALARNAQRS